MHVRGLPTDSAFGRGLRGADWTIDNEIAAATFDAVQRLSYYFVSANGAKNASEPEPFPRPTDLQRPRKDTATTDLQGFANFLQG